MEQEHRPLLASDHHRIGTPDVTAIKHQVKRFLTSKSGHYAVLLLVSLDISAIFADLILQLLTCESLFAIMGSIQRKYIVYPAPMGSMAS